ncbi:hypothetical protein SVAN01_08799 [Stagonosporopsis vannaccii]|nr:hypothetical protein SVAN01_08799 [Stagonosporopsis vannaccii]
MRVERSSQIDLTWIQPLIGPVPSSFAFLHIVETNSGQANASLSTSPSAKDPFGGQAVSDTSNILRAALSQESQHTLLHDGLPWSLKVDVRPLPELPAATNTQQLQAARKPQRRGFRKQLRDFFAGLAGHRRDKQKSSPKAPQQLDTVVAEQENKHMPVPELSGSGTWNYYMADDKYTLCPSEMSPDSPKSELYSPPSDSPSDYRSAFSSFGSSRSPWSAEQQRQTSTALKYDAPGTSIAELPGNWNGFLRSDVSPPIMTYYHSSGTPGLDTSGGWDSCYPPTSAASAVPHPTWPQQNNMLLHEIGDNTGSSLDAAQPMTLAIPDHTQAVPDLSPQTSSHKSYSPTMPDTPVTAGGDILTSSAETHTALEHLVSPYGICTPLKHDDGIREPFIQQLPDDCVPLDLATSTLADLDFVAFSTRTAQLPTHEQIGVDAQAVWPQTHGMAFLSHLQQGKTYFGNQIASGNGTLPFHTGLDPVLEFDFTAPHLGLNRSRTSPTRMLGPQQSSLGRTTESGNMDANGQGSAAAHMDAPSTSERVYLPVECQHCPQVFNGQFARGNMRRHVKQMHRRNSGVDCQLCNKTFNRGDALRNHERLAHPHLGRAPPKKRKAQLKKQPIS